MKDVSTQHAFKCKRCVVSLDLGNMRKGAVTNHMQSKKHVSAMEINKSQSNCLLKAQSITESPTENHPLVVFESVAVGDTADGQAESLPGAALKAYMVGKQVSKTEALVARNLAANYQSNNSN